MLVNAPGRQHVMTQASGSLPSTGETGIEFRLLASTCPARVVAAIWELWICRWNISLSPCFVTLPFKSMNKQCSKGCFKQYFSKQNKLYNVFPKFSPNGIFQITGASQPLRAAIRPGSLQQTLHHFSNHAFLLVLKPIHTQKWLPRLWYYLPYAHISYQIHEVFPDSFTSLSSLQQHVQHMLRKGTWPEMCMVLKTRSCWAERPSSWFLFFIVKNNGKLRWILGNEWMN